MSSSVPFSSPSSYASLRMVTVLCKDGKFFTFSDNDMGTPVVLKRLLDENFDKEYDSMSFTKVSSFILSKIMAYCSKHCMTGKKGTSWRYDDLRQWDIDFIYSLSKEDLNEVMLACRYLNVQPLYEMARLSLGLTRRSTKDIVYDSDIDH